MSGQTPVERAARVLLADYDGQYDASHIDWQEFESLSRATLAAALDVDELARVLQQATDDGADRTEDYARAVVAHLTKGNENDE